MIVLRSLLFAMIFYPGSLSAALSSPIAALFGRPALIRHAIRWTRFHHWCARVLLRIDTRVEGEMPTGPVLIAAKHEAMYETLELVRLLNGPAVVLKQELADLPFWGWAARRYGCVPVDRAGSAAALRRMTADAKAHAATGRQVVIYPEGTRVPPGESPPLRPGFAGLYRTLGLPVVPVALDSGTLLPRGRFLKRPGVVTIRFGAPVPPGLPRREAEARVHEAINQLNGAAL
ncbi:lysophospholipid acyltransferase family protein [Sphingomonas jatrophae]|uniref:1-acyl-sn-glycerol-3-phosphate acyltransferase n=1 Tax=Sphingomonas jatrophae TaxID=1166337 RepID=A0A1I6LN33_9SPHN|nr:lysophospholipid acyltransferase family protein [Sphingomonas jatrophae]SFS04906.1 1-acyl-sn-glycerol-3-phosphate acyltransferase [Sphingomonas jatrophae]